MSNTDVIKKHNTIFPVGTGKMALLVSISIIAVYLLPSIIKDLWFISLIYFYLKSRDEVFWLTFIFILTDGIAGFFFGRTVSIESIPIIPEFEFAHIYLIAALFKLSGKRHHVYIFYENWLRVLLIFILILLLVGVMEGIPDDYSLFLRNIRNIFPLFLIYLVPKILTKQKEFERFFSFVFLLAIIAFITQIFSVLFGASPQVILGLREGRIIEETHEQIYRGFYNNSANLLSFFCALFYLASNKAPFKRIYLQVILICVFLTVIFTASRGWILGFSLTLILYFTIVQKVDLRKIIVFALSIFLAIQVLMIFPRLRAHTISSFERLTTVGYIMEGDVTAAGTVSRLSEYRPEVLQKWRESPLWGWGYSSVYYKYSNPHVGNENILLHSGIIGATLMGLFIMFFFGKLYMIKTKTRRTHKYNKSLLVFPVFFIGWFFIHSSSGQHFAYLSSYYLVFTQATFLGFGATIYREIIEEKYKFKTTYEPALIIRH